MNTAILLFRLGLHFSAASFYGAEVDFCQAGDTDRFATVLEQPDEHHERISSYVLNQTHFTIEWRADERLCGRNVTEYWVNVETTSWLINSVLYFYGRFPQSTCQQKDSKSVQKIRTQDGSVPNSCSPYPEGCYLKKRVSSIQLPPGLWALVRWADVTFRVHTWGALAQPECNNSTGLCKYSTTDITPMDFACLVFRRKSSPARTDATPKEVQFQQGGL
mmetsp:Transcript_16195/g.32294  ORF Transcript_16195/g.32294 Transcript_16195/m.32294 type:complete len:219 (-) Transcript_16195:10-666(-)